MPASIPPCCRPQGPGRSGQRPVPGRDDPVDATWIVARQDELARAGGWKDATLEPLQVLGRDAEILGGFVDLAERLRHRRLALVKRESAAHLIPAALDGLR